MAKKVQFDLSQSSEVITQSDEEIGNLKTEILGFRKKFDRTYPELRKNILIWGFIGLFVSALIFGAIANSFDVFKALGIVFKGDSPLLINFYEMLFLEAIAIALFVLVYQLAYVIHPASLWESFGPIRVTVQVPRAVRVRASATMQKSDAPPLAVSTEDSTAYQSYEATLVQKREKTGELFVAVDKADWDRAARSHTQQTAAANRQ